jgi:hypothetical protein
VATQSRIKWTNGDPLHPATVTIFWDDVTLFLNRVVVDNTQGIYPLPCKATVLKNGRTFQATVQPGNTLDQAIATNQANRMELFINPDNGRLDGVDWSIG